MPADYSSYLMVAKRMLNDAETLLMDKKWEEARMALWDAEDHVRLSRAWVIDKMEREGMTEGER